ncbi:hypothetical protein LO763_06035 [Glycomyces sp. A-F 0318]|uniref:hypothetical protein n=1 Tax=Glycomyces amatae TaxID=2881355 RepID=UPI001E5111CF|nr:hypothetical protein [Glycomyces amatae]MCD0443187.1 hypothetical protein [Glycomyces amatae]
MLKAAGLSAANRCMLKMVLSAVFTSAVDEIISFNPCRCAKTDPVPTKPLVIITPAQFDRFYHVLSDAMSKILVETGMRWGELTELRPKDFDRRTGPLQRRMGAAGRWGRAVPGARRDPPGTGQESPENPPPCGSVFMQAS